MAADEVYEDDLDHEDFDQEDEEQEKATGFAGFLQQKMPTFMMSTAVHAFILFIISLLPGQAIEVTKKVVIVQDTTEVVEEEAPPEMEQIEIEEVTEVTLDETTEPEEEMEVEVPMEEAMENEEIAEVFTEITNSANPDNMPTATIGLSGGAPGGGGLPSGYNGRSKKGMKRGMGKYGGGKGTQNAVDSALAWLHHHQETDGSWSCQNYGGSFKGDIGVTGVALLAFLGAGHSEKVGKYKETVAKGIKWLNGVFDARDLTEAKAGRASEHGYGYAMAMMALSEASIFGTSSRTLENANKLVKWHLDGYYKAGARANPKKVAWRYEGGTDSADQSVSGWVALALKSAKAAELKEMNTKDAHDFFYLYEEFVKANTSEDTGEGAYTGGDFGKRINMNVVGMFQRQFLGFPRNDPFLTKAAAQVENGRATALLGGASPVDVYGIYYGTLASFQQQGTLWTKWNNLMKPCLLGSQRKGSPKDLGGSWDPDGSWTAGKGGRVMETALLALCLEIYYRYGIM